MTNSTKSKFNDRKSFLAFLIQNEIMKSREEKGMRQFCYETQRKKMQCKPSKRKPRMRLLNSPEGTVEHDLFVIQKILNKIKYNPGCTRGKLFCNIA